MAEPKPVASLALVLPVLNEEASLERALERCAAGMRRVATDFEIIVVNDGSSDRTGELADRFAARDPHVRVLHNPRNVNYGISLKRGIDAARSEWLFHNGADLPLAPEDLPLVLPHLEDNDVVVIARFDRSAHSPWRRVTSLVNNGLLRLAFRPRCQDLNFTQFYRRAVLDALPLRSTSPAFVTPELIIGAERAGFRVVEITLEFRRREQGVGHFGRPKDILWTLRDMLVLRVRTLLFGWPR